LIRRRWFVFMHIEEICMNANPFRALLGLACMLSSTACGTQARSAPAPPPPDVQVAAVVQQSVPIHHEYIATLDGFVNAVIQPQAQLDAQLAMVQLYKSVGGGWQ
jgi:hypothetical protein